MRRRRSLEPMRKSNVSGVLVILLENFSTRRISRVTANLSRRMNEVLSLDTDPFLKGSNAATPAPRQREIPAASHAEDSPPWPEMGEDSDDLAKFRMMLDKDD